MQSTYTTQYRNADFEAGFSAGQAELFKAKKSTAARIIMDAGLYVVCVIVLLNWAFQLGGFIEEGATARQHQATIERLEAQLAAIDKRLGIKSDKMEIRVK